MKKLTKKDYLMIFLIIILLFISVYLTTGDKYQYASFIDWSCQHYKIPEYFRNLFYETGNLFPNFAFNLGAGQNIYNMSYYGLFSPIIMFSYLLPFVSMKDYVMASGLLLTILSIFLIYKWINDKYDWKIASLSTLLFLCSTPIVFHLHRHIMFVNYIPFTIMGLIGVDKHFKENKDFLLIISVTLIILSSYFFSVGALLSIVLYGIYNYLKYEKNVNLKSFTIRGLMFAKPIVIALMNSMILLLPTFLSLINGRSKANVKVDLSSLFIPSFEMDEMLYGNYTTGMSMILIFSIIYFLLKKEKHKRFLGISTFVIMTFPIFLFLLNGTMYLDGKVLIPFIPLFVLMIGNTLNDIFNNKESLKKPLIYFAIFTSIAYILNLNNKRAIFMLLDASVLLLSIIAYQRKNKKLFVVIPLVLTFIYLLFTTCFTDRLVELNDRLFDYEEVTNYIEKLTQEDEEFYRINYLTKDLTSANKIYTIDEYQTGIYSSVSNNSYKDFYYNRINNEIMYRSTGQIISTENLFFNLYMNNKYILSKNLDNIFYHEIDSFKLDNKEEVKVYRSNNTLPLGYATNKLMNVKEYEKLTYPENVLAYFKYTIVDDKVKANYKEKSKKVKLDYKIINKENVNVEKKDNIYYIDAKKKNNLKLKLNENLQDKVLLIRFNMDYNQNCSRGDMNITINGIVNKLTCKNWKYHNNNNTFEYTLANEDVSTLNIEFSKGHFELSNIEIYAVDHEELKMSKNEIDEFEIDREETKGDIIKGKINVKENSYFKLSIPYDKGFKIYVDNILTDYEKVDYDFIGFEIEKGKHNIKIEYVSPGEKIAKAITFIGITITLITIYLEVGITKTKVNFKKEEVKMEKAKKEIKKRSKIKKLYTLIKRSYITYKEIINYLIVGVLTTIISIASFAIFDYIGVGINIFNYQIKSYIVATILSWCVAVIFAYIMNRKYVFESKDSKILIEFIKFIGARIMSLLAELICMWLLVEILTINELLSKIFVQFLVVVLNYIFSKIFVFKKN